MKLFIRKTLSSILIISTLLCALPSANAHTDDSRKTCDNGAFCMTMAIGKRDVYIKGKKHDFSPPLMVFGKTYVNINSYAPALGITLQWADGNPRGYMKASYRGKSAQFSTIRFWDDVKYAKHRFFIKDSSLYVSLRELVDLTDCEISFSDGVIKVTDGLCNCKCPYGEIEYASSDKYLYKNYTIKDSFSVNPYTAYSYEKMLEDARELEYNYPHLIKTSTIGKSVEGRDIVLIEFGRGSKKIFSCGAHHAREYISATYLMYAIDRYANSFRKNEMWNGYSPRKILDEVTFCIVPMVNPDGVNLVQNGLNSTKHAEDIARMEIFQGKKYSYRAWKANIHGVDVNWNYDKDWTIERNKNERGSTGFNGYSPATEPETVAVSDYVDSNEFEAFLSFHTQGQIFYWATDGDEFSSLSDEIHKDTGFKGFREKAEGVGGSFFDYVFRKYKKPTFTFELCPFVGNYPYPDSDFDTVWRPAQNILLLIGNRIVKAGK